MGRYNSRGQFAMGVGDGEVSIDNRSIAKGTDPLYRGGGGPGWWVDDDQLLYQTADGHVAIYDQRTSISKQVDPHPANSLGAGGGVWAAWNPRDGLFSSTGFARSPARLVDVSPQGAIAYIDEADWSTVRVRALDGREWTITNYPDGVQIRGDGVAIWQKGHILGGTGLPIPALDQVGTPRAVVLPNGESWLLYWRWTDGPLCLCPLANPRYGYVITPREQPAFGADLVVRSPTVIRVGWATGAGEQPGFYAHVDQDLTLPRTDLRPPPPLPLIPRPIWLGTFLFGAVPDRIGNCVLPVGAPMLVRTTGGRPIARYVSVEPDGTIPKLNAAIAAARAADPSLPVIPYWTDGLQALPDLPDNPEIGMEAYVWDSSTLEQFQAKKRGTLARLRDAGRRIWLIAQGYTNHDPHAPDLSALVPIYLQMAADFPIDGMLVFSDGPGRATGLLDYPEARALWRQAAGRVLTPVLPPPPVPVPLPKVEPKPMPNFPSLDQWAHVEWPQIREARRFALSDPNWEPDDDWRWIQMARRYGFGLPPGEAPWTLQKMIVYERAQKPTEGP